MKTDDFEQQLRKQPLRGVPPDWRAELLIVARAARAVHGQSEPTVPWWREWLWPCPQAWAGLAALWLLLAGLHMTAPSSNPLASQSMATDQQAGLEAQRRELARLLDAPPEPAPVPKSPSPRSMAEPRGATHVSGVECRSPLPLSVFQI